MVWGIPGIQRAVERHFQTHMRGGEDEVLASAAWPVGSVFISVVATDPSTLLGFGTWTAFGAGRVLVGLNAADTDFDTVEDTGGSKTQSDHTGHGAHGDHSNHSTHPLGDTPVGTGQTMVETGTHAAHSAHSANAAISAHGTNMPPYIVVYMFKRVS